jgi:hypothetical protein
MTPEDFEKFEIHIERIVEEKVSSRLNKLVLAVLVAGVGSVTASVGSVMWAGFEWGKLKTRTEQHDSHNDHHISTFVTRQEWLLTQSAQLSQLTDIKEALRELSTRLNNKTAALLQDETAPLIP